MKFILDHFKKLDRLGAVRIVVNARRIEIQHLAIERLLAAANVADSFEELFPIITAAGTLETLVIHGESLDDILAQSCRCPLAKLSGHVRLDAVAYRYDEVKIIVLNPPRNLSISFLLNYQVFLDSCLSYQFALFKYIDNVEADILHCGIEQFRQLRLRQPHCLALHAYLNTRYPTVAFVNNDFIFLLIFHTKLLLTLYRSPALRNSMIVQYLSYIPRDSLFSR